MVVCVPALRARTTVKDYPKISSTMGEEELYVHVLVASSKWRAKPHEQHTKCDIAISNGKGTSKPRHGRKIQPKRTLAPWILSFALVSSPPVSVLKATP